MNPLSFVDGSLPVAREELQIRRKIDQAVGRALVDREFQSRLLAEPTLALDGTGCSPKQYLDLRAIRATSLQQFAAQVTALFWPAPLSYRAERPASIAVGF